MTDTAMLVQHQEPGIALGLLQAHSPREVVTVASEIARALAAVIEDRRLYVTLSGRRYVKCEGWTTLGAMCGVMPCEVGLEEHDGIFTAIVELRRIADGGVIARASAECGAPDELSTSGKPTWATRPRYARRSMALTRATAKACRLAFSWILVLAKFEPTPAEEMSGDDEGDRVPPRAAVRLVEGAGLISKAQQKRFFTIAKEHGWTTAALKDWLQGYGYTSSSQIPVLEYDRLVRALEVPEGPADGDPA
jgi:hypothetical protein